MKPKAPISRTAEVLAQVRSSVKALGWSAEDLLLELLFNYKCKVGFSSVYRWLRPNYNRPISSENLAVLQAWLKYNKAKTKKNSVN